MANGESPAFKLFGKTILQPEDSKQSTAAAAETAAAAAAAEAASASDTVEAGGAAEEQQAAPRAAPGRCLPCPRCRSKETKFCYFNNYNVNQPRHFCKNCHRYWTAGGTLRNVPVGAGRRKNRPPPPVAAAEPGVQVKQVI